MHDDNEAIAGLAKNVGMVFFFLTRFGAGATMYARRQVTNVAYKVMNDANFHTLPSEIRTVITHLTSEAEIAVATFKSKLRDLDLEKKNLFNGFVTLNSDLQKAFHAEFSKMSIVNLTLLNNETNAVARWSR